MKKKKQLINDARHFTLNPNTYANESQYHLSQVDELKH